MCSHAFYTLYRWLSSTLLPWHTRRVNTINECNTYIHTYIHINFTWGNVPNSHHYWAICISNTMFLFLQDYLPIIKNHRHLAVDVSACELSSSTDPILISSTTYPTYHTYTMAERRMTCIYKEPRIPFTEKSYSVVSTQFTTASLDKECINLSSRWSHPCWYRIEFLLLLDGQMTAGQYEMAFLAIHHDRVFLLLQVQRENDMSRKLTVKYVVVCAWVLLLL